MASDSKIYDFSDKFDAELSQVGGKAFSLIRMSKAKLPVPPGFVLPVSFFDDWFVALEETKAWAKFVNSEGEAAMQKNCKALKAEAAKLRFSEVQAQAISDALKKVDAPSPVFAVRSSSPEEDLEGSSFAGGYETILGVKSDQLEDAVIRAFSSCLDHRIVVYKQQHGFDWKKPRIAVVVQLQIASEIAGVGFSVNPITNYFDEAVFNANWGLGETVVAGLATPDTFIVNKVNNSIVSKELGAKQVSIVLKEDGGTEEVKDSRSTQLTLSDSQVLELAKMIADVEGLYKRAVDIEWAYSKDKLYLLQARPVTTNIPLPEEMITAPKDRRRLYLDATISVQGLYKPLSPMGTSFIRTLFRKATKYLFNRDFTQNVVDSPVIATQGRLYLNLSNVFALAGKENVVKVISNMDHLTSRALESVDPAQYQTTSKEIKKHPTHLLIWRAPQMGLRFANAVLLPEMADKKCQTVIREFMKWGRDFAKKDMAFSTFAETLTEKTAVTIFTNTVPRFLSSRVALEEMKKCAGEELVASVDFNSLEKSLPHNPTVEMGLALYQLAKLLPEGLDAKELSERLVSGADLSTEFKLAWRRYMDLYGHRGPTELDMASPRYRDDPKTLLEQVISLRKSSTDEDNPQARFDANKKERQNAAKRISAEIGKKDPLKQQLFKASYHVYENLGGYREAHKYLLIFALDLVRQRVLKHAKEFVHEGRLDNEEQVFDLTIEQVQKALGDWKFDLRKAGRENRKFIDRLAACKQLPSLIDSRGLIIRPPRREAKVGEFLGSPISAGIARGPAKTLHSPDEKPLNKGEILIAQATDPGWTPLFVNASAVVLEIGGMLQHGALVAREYGLPCVAGVENATELWKDGTILEVDGANGIIRVIENNN